MPLSVLLRRTMTFLSPMVLIMSMSSLSRGLLASMTNITRSERLKASLLFSIPILSMVSSVSLIPAVSVNTTGISLMTSVSSMVSLVVPGMSVTIALFSPMRAFISEDFPTLGFPIIEIFRPSLIIRPVSDVESSLSIFSFIFKIDFFRLSYVICSISSSG